VDLERPLSHVWPAGYKACWWFGLASDVRQLTKKWHISRHSTNHKWLSISCLGLGVQQGYLPPLRPQQFNRCYKYRPIPVGEMVKSRLMLTKMTMMNFNAAISCCSPVTPQSTRVRDDLRLIGPALSPEVTDRGHRVIWGHPRLRPRRSKANSYYRYYTADAWLSTLDSALSDCTSIVYCEATRVYRTAR